MSNKSQVDFYYCAGKAALNSKLNHQLVQQKRFWALIPHTLFQGKLTTTWVPAGQDPPSKDAIYVGSGRIAETWVSCSFW
ncbi:hypothetical protein [Spirosoma gilvum]